MLKYLLHAGAIIKLVQAVEVLVAFEIQSKGSVPSKEMVQAVIDGLKDLIDDGVIDFPGIDQNSIDPIIAGVESAILGLLK